MSSIDSLVEIPSIPPPVEPQPLALPSTVNAEQSNASARNPTILELLEDTEVITTDNAHQALEVIANAGNPQQEEIPEIELPQREEGPSVKEDHPFKHYEEVVRNIFNDPTQENIERLYYQLKRDKTLSKDDKIRYSKAFWNTFYERFSSNDEPQKIRQDDPTLAKSFSRKKLDDVNQAYAFFEKPAADFLLPSGTEALINQAIVQMTANNADVTEEIKKVLQEQCKALVAKNKLLNTKHLFNLFLAFAASITFMGMLADQAEKGNQAH